MAVVGRTITTVQQPLGRYVADIGETSGQGVDGGGRGSTAKRSSRFIRPEGSRTHLKASELRT